MYDAWQGQSQFLTTPSLAKPLQFNSLSLEDNDYDDDLTNQKISDSDTRLMEMLAAQAAHRDGTASEDENAVASDEKLTEPEKKDTLQKALNMAASNGDVERILRILNGKAKDFVDIDAPDEEGTAPLIYAKQSPEELEDEGQEFDWTRCLHDQMFVFQENELDRILDIIITNMTPQRSPSQKPVPANMIFLSARYAHYHADANLLGNLLITAMDKINDVVEKNQWDMTILAFWISNATLLLHYLKKDAGLSGSTSDFQLQLAELINEIFILIIRDAERRMDKCFSSLGNDDLEALVGTLQQLTRLSWQQLIHAVKHYRPEVGEKGLPKSAMKYLNSMQRETQLRKTQKKNAAVSQNTTPIQKTGNSQPPNPSDANGKPTKDPAHDENSPDDEYDAPENLLLDPALMLPFSLPTSTDMLISYGAGFGGVNRERERKYIPTIPPEFLAKLDLSGGRAHSTFEERDWDNEDE
ncbi:putative Dilute domain-containing protein C25B8.08 [Glarea lozoyensis 74030]|uniref:Putative Dilute domain-containing protein C25B8.08 n=1 Tax=Glarea lozoyensis (strain ATCC 74030 / MF5533) TaxID=1104152 RepID=H0EDR3_GLAL7|nr:putative Dilute domain-containing protein C25B8.08 [Glarea lozoyensis 74030]